MPSCRGSHCSVAVFEERKRAQNGEEQAARRKEKLVNETVCQPANFSKGTPCWVRRHVCVRWLLLQDKAHTQYGSWIQEKCKRMPRMQEKQLLLEAFPGSCHPISVPLEMALCLRQHQRTYPISFLCFPRIPTPPLSSSLCLESNRKPVSSLLWKGFLRLIIQDSLP